MITEEIDETSELPREDKNVLDGIKDEEKRKKSARSVSTRAKIATFLYLVIIGFGAGAWYLHSQGYESTDDAQVDGHINAISSRIGGTVAKVYVEDNQHVRAGDVLVDLDTSELAIAEQQSAAQFSQASAQLSSEQPTIIMTRNSNEADIAQAQSKLADAQAALSAAEHDRETAISRLAEAKATANRDQLQAKRYQHLYDKEECSRQEFENYQATAQASDARLAGAEAAVASAEQIVDQRQAQLSQQKANSERVLKNAPHELAVRLSAQQAQHANVELAKAVWDRSKLNLSFAHVVAPVAGIVTQRSAEPGNRISEGQQLLMIVDVSDVWVTANFKETQLRKMHAGCKAKLKVDAFGRTLEGVVESMPAITGSRASVLPPENATGNYVKVIQRLPVRIKLVRGQIIASELRPGMSVEATVYVP